MFSKEENKGKIPLFAGIDKARFKKPVYPGDQLIIKVEIVKMVRGIGKAKAEVYVDDNLVAFAELLFTAVAVKRSI
jgi:3-hydroxyacyl-[acyl-carrier-protein] dehydratase